MNTPATPVPAMPVSLDGWDITRAADTDWMPWGEGDHARAKIVGSADGYLVALVEAEPGYTGTPHEHTSAEFLFLIEGRLRNQGQIMQSGDGYGAAAGSTHVDFAAEQPSRYLSIFKL